MTAEEIRAQFPPRLIDRWIVNAHARYIKRQKPKQKSTLRALDEKLARLDSVQIAEIVKKSLR